MELLRASRGERRQRGGRRRRAREGELVGMGLEDPELLMLKAVCAIKAADLVLYDRPVSNDVMDLVR
jgi:siroheme synthase